MSKKQPATFVIPGTTADVARAKLAGRGRDRFSNLQVRVDGERVRVTREETMKGATRPTWDGTVADTLGGARFAGRVHARLNTVVDTVCLVGALVPSAALVWAVMTGDDALATMMLVPAAIMWLVLWYRRHTYHLDAAQHVTDVEGLISSLLR